MSDEPNAPPAPETPPPDAPADDSPPFVIVGVGASAGGLDALEAMFRRFALNSMAFIVVQHLSPDQESHLPEILQRFTKMKVVAAGDGVRVEPNTVYAITPNVNLALLHGVLHQMPPSVDRGQSIDFLFRSLAEDRGAYAVGVVLSGTGSDGSVGLKAIKAEGGLTFVQKPTTARFDGMPLAALESGAADFCLPPEGIADELMQLAQHPYLKRHAPLRTTTPERLGKIFVLLRDAFGHDMSLYKHGTIERRIQRRMAVNKIERLEDYIVYLQGRPGELATLYRDLLIGVTSFFRDHEPVDALKSMVFPKLVERRKSDSPIRIWVPGCSTGEEAYSIAIALLEFLGDRAPLFKLQIFASDVDDEAVQVARRGIYPPQITLDVSPDRIQRFFVPRQGGYQVSRRLRDMVVFATQNVTKDPPFSRLDLVSCRNLLIYFQPVLQKKVLRIFHYALNPEGFLLLGTSETVGDSPELFTLVDRKAKVYRKKNMPSSATFDVTFGEAPPRGGESAMRASSETKPMANVQQLADRRILERIGPPGVVINENFEVLQFRGKTGPYLEPLPGTASLNLLKLARPELMTDLRGAIHRALETNAPVSVRGLTVKGDGPRRTLDLEVLPIVEPETRGRCLVVLFVDVGEAASPEALSQSDDRGPDVDPRIQELERELGATKEYLQSTIEELETANEELKSANEELQSANEELQSTNEELETSKEELQSTNEELTTVNDELHSRMGELSQSNDDLQNLLGVIDAPVVIVGLDLRIRRFTQGAERLLNLIQADLGRPVAHLSWFMPAGAIERMITRAIEHLTLEHEELTAASGRRYRVSAVPYKTADHVIKGAVLTFVELPFELPAKS